jgi:hypothetical protein
MRVALAEAHLASASFSVGVPKPAEWRTWRVGRGAVRWVDLGVVQIRSADIMMLIGD